MTTAPPVVDRGGHTVERQQVRPQPLRRPALTAGLGLLAMAILGGATNVLVIEGLVTADNAAQTAGDVLASEGLFRFGIVALLVVAILDVIVAWGLYAFFAPVDEGLSRIAAWLRLAYAAVLVVAVGHLMTAVGLLNSAETATGADVGLLQADALQQITLYQEIWSMGLAVFGLHLVLIGYLALVSGYVPKWLAALIALAGVGYVVDSVGAILMADFPITVSLVTFIGEVLLMLWLLVFGRRVVPATAA